MKLHKIKKLTIVTESSILDNILEVAQEFGAEGYTVGRVAGKGESGNRLGFDISGMLSSVRIAIIIKEEAALKIAAAVEERYFENYAGMIYFQDVEVTQARKFGISE